MLWRSSQLLMESVQHHTFQTAEEGDETVLAWLLWLGNGDNVRPFPTLREDSPGLVDKVSNAHSPSKMGTNWAGNPVTSQVSMRWHICTLLCYILSL